MPTATNLKSKMGSGLQPASFVAGMTRNREEFLSWHRRFSWREEDEAFFRSIGEREKIHCLILCTDWCPDVIWNAPVLFQVMEHGKIPTEVLLMEQHLETMDLFLTDGGRAQPIAVFLNDEGDVLGKWGARPQYIQAVMNEFRRRHPDRGAPDYQEKVSLVREEIARIYNSGTEYQDVIVQELRVLFTNMLSITAEKEA